MYSYIQSITPLRPQFTLPHPLLIIKHAYLGCYTATSFHWRSSGLATGIRITNLIMSVAHSFNRGYCCRHKVISVKGHLLDFGYRITSIYEILTKLLML